MDDKPLSTTKLPELLRTMFCLLLLLSHVETGDPSCPTNLIILRNLFLTYRESDINGRVFSRGCYQTCQGGLVMSYWPSQIQGLDIPFYLIMSQTCFQIFLYDLRFGDQRETTVRLHHIISILRYNYQLVVRAGLPIVSILRTARVSVSIKVWRHLKSHL